MIDLLKDKNRFRELHKISELPRPYLYISQVRNPALLGCVILSNTEGFRDPDLIHSIHMNSHRFQLTGYERSIRRNSQNRLQCLLGYAYLSKPMNVRWKMEDTVP